MRRERTSLTAFASPGLSLILRPRISATLCPLHSCLPSRVAPCMAAKADQQVHSTRRTRYDSPIDLHSHTTYGSVSRTPTATVGDAANSRDARAELQPDYLAHAPDVERADGEDGGGGEIEGEGGPPKVDFRLIVAAVGFIAALTTGGVAAASGALSPDKLVALSEWFEKLGPNAVFLYSALYFVLELVGVPALPLTLGSGYLFGVVKGTIAVSAAATAASAAAFLIARYGLRDSVSKLASRYPRFRAMDRAIGREGFKFVLLLRLSPLLPFSISNYLYGLTSVDLAPYVAGSWLGMLPGTIAYVSAGAAVNALTDLDGGSGQVNPGLVVLGLAATVGALWTVGKMATGAIDAEDEEEVMQR